MLIFAILRAISLVLIYFILTTLISFFLPNETNHFGYACLQIISEISLIFVFNSLIIRELDFGILKTKIGVNYVFIVLFAFLIVGVNFLLIALFSTLKFQPTRFVFSHFIESVIILFLASLAEEYFFRRILIENIRKFTGVFASMVISSSLFSMAHFFNTDYTLIAYVNLFLGGMLLSLIYTKYHVLGSVLFHFSWNISQTFLGSRVSGNTFYHFLDIRYEFNIFTGNNFGFESSLANSLVLLGAISYLLKYHLNTKNEPLYEG